MKTIVIFFSFFIVVNTVFANNFIRDNQNNIVLDTTTNLMWQDDQSIQEIEKNWGEAIDYCENNVTLGGYDDWRLPNSFELNSIVDRTRISPVLNYTFKYPNISINNVFWSSSSKYNDDDHAWVIEFTRGTFSGYYIKDDGNYDYLGVNKNDDSHFIRCVRDAN